MIKKHVRFLLVEDDLDHAEITISTIEQTPHAIDHVTDGELALRFLWKEGEFADRSRPDVILLDLKLPKVDGLEVLKRVKEDPQLRSIPVVILTTSASEQDRTEAYAHHVNSYVVKPLNFDAYVDLISDLASYWARTNAPA